MLKKLLSVAALGALLSSSAFAEDILAKVSNGAISDNSAGVKVLSLDEMKEVKGGFNFVRDSRYDNIAGIRSYAYVVTDADKSQLQISSNSKVLAKYRYVNNQKDYYLQSYNNGTLGTIFPNYSTSWGQYAMKIMNEFRSKY
ncbi:TPA: hypothetical protein R8Q36_000001 [Campylobacter jejuni]|uniref:Bacteriocin-type signal sequence domain-containing protein n=4 Tax=Campylobacter TaxID=194 RepID=A0AAX2M3L7_CAMJU|nr:MULTISPECIES: hypothetical protein [Campylobacter]EAI7421868.1 hypothetical protein [Campylobacter hyointestinalis]AZR09621.1 hypothetical protein A17_01817 [Campylobacter jejuni subsp. jejuni]EAH4540362.1 hypothetical protein [Campylobacter jejuni]EAH4794090.1 hypothetical protein [Campylobacter jejuni]EAH4875665.1 hypothetical protein [Campylobacter coli]